MAPSSLCRFPEALCFSSAATACGPVAFHVIPIPFFFLNTNHAPGNISCHMTSSFFIAFVLSEVVTLSMCLIMLLIFHQPYFAAGLFLLFVVVDLRIVDTVCT